MNNKLSANITAEQEKSLIDLVKEKLGIVINHQKHELIKTIKDACVKFQCNPDEYLELLKSASDQSPLLEHLVLGVTIGETYFFRDKNQMRLLKENVLPEIIEKKRDQKQLQLRIWSAGCSTGEEIYTLAMMLYELLPDIEYWQINLLGTDINANVLKKALKGHYREWSMRSISDYYKRRFFTRDDSEYIILPKIRDLVNFSYLNLNDDFYPSIYNGTNSQDLILCRNVLIYFENKKIEYLMKKLSNSLNPDGYLLLGASDPVLLSGTELALSSHHGNFFSKSIVESIIKPPVQNIKVEQKPFIKQKVTLQIERKVELKPVSSDYESKITLLMNQSKWNDAFQLINKNEDKLNSSPFLLRSKATVLANLGKLDEASSLCKASIDLDGANKYSYFTYALVLTEVGQLDEAESMLKKSIFLDNQFVSAYFQLGLLKLRKKHTEAGLKCLKNALSIAISQELSKVVPESTQLTYGQLAEILKHEIDLHEKQGNNAYANKDTEHQ